METPEKYVLVLIVGNICVIGVGINILIIVKSKLGIGKNDTD